MLGEACQEPSYCKGSMGLESLDRFSVLCSLPDYGGLFSEIYAEHVCHLGTRMHAGSSICWKVDGM